jgi:uncharacterized protein YeaO (DUF488 family)
MALKLKRVYEKPGASDGVRILVDRLWPRGVSKSNAKVDQWLKELAPSHELRKWFGHRPDRWKEFRTRYRRELASPERREMMAQLRQLASRKRVTLLFAAKDPEHCNATVLADLLNRTQS